MRSVTDGKTLHSMHSYFMRPADIGAEVRYEVELLRDGRGYSTRQVRGFQNGKPSTSAWPISPRARHGRRRSRRESPSDLPAPETLPSRRDYLADRAGGTMTEDSRRTGPAGAASTCGTCPVRSTRGRGRRGRRTRRSGSGRSTRCARSPGLSDAQRDLAALAYVCDYTILEPVLRVLGLPWAEPGLVTASLDHAMWFHRRRAGLDGWLLYAQEAVAADAGAALGTGRFFTRDGAHLATVAQEGHDPPGSDEADVAWQLNVPGHGQPMMPLPAPATRTRSPATTCRPPTSGRRSSSPPPAAATRTGSTPAAELIDVPTARFGADRPALRTPTA